MYLADLMLIPSIFFVSIRVDKQRSLSYEEQYQHFETEYDKLIRTQPFKDFTDGIRFIEFFDKYGNWFPHCHMLVSAKENAEQVLEKKQKRLLKKYSPIESEKGTRPGLVI